MAKLKAKLTEKEKGELVTRLKGMKPEDLAEWVDGLFVQDEAAGGDFVVDLAPVDGWANEDVAGLKATSADWKEKAQKRGSRLNALDDISPAELAELRRKASRAGKDGAGEGDTEAAKKIEKLEGEREHWKTKYRSKVHSEAIDAAMSEAKVGAKWRPAIKKHLESTTQIIEVNDGEDFNVVVTGENGNPKPSMRRGSGTNPMMVLEELETMRDSDDWAEMFDGTGRKGLQTQAGDKGGESGKGGEMKNPLLPDSRNLKLAAELKKENPELYERFAKEAEAAAFPQT